MDGLSLQRSGMRQAFRERYRGSIAEMRISKALTASATVPIVNQLEMVPGENLTD